MEKERLFKGLGSVGIFILILFGLPLILNLIEINQRIIFIQFLGNFLIFLIICICFMDLVFLIVKKKNIFLFFFLNMFLSISLIILIEYSFLNNLYEFVYVWRYSDSDLPVLYKLIAIWAGGAGSIMAWMVLNSIFIFFFRIKNQNKEDIVFIRSIILTVSIMIIFLLVLWYFDPFMTFGNLNENVIIQIYNHAVQGIQAERLLYPNGFGLWSILRSPLLLWHPFFTFCSYAIILIPFSVTLAEIITPREKLKNSYQKEFFDFCLRFGWLISTLALGLGAYWARIAENWENRYWYWDVVETSLLLRWIFNTAYFHTLSFQKKKKNILIRLTIILTFLSIIFAALIVRGGGFTSLHAYIRGKEIVLYVIIIGSIMLLLTVYITLIVIDLVSDMYKKPKIFIDYSSFIFYYFLAFICIIGLLLPPLTYFLAEFLPITVVNIDPQYYIYGTAIPFIGIAISLIFCSLWNLTKRIIILKLIFIIFFIQMGISLFLLFFIDIWINPIISIYFTALYAALYKFKKDSNLKKGFRLFFRTNSKTIIHIGISMILIGSIGGPMPWQDFFYITGFYILLIGIVPSLLVFFFISKKETNSKPLNKQIINSM
jgi:cytochrome c-type biogenesis protein CcmF